METLNRPSGGRKVIFFFFIPVGTFIFLCFWTLVLLVLGPSGLGLGLIPWSLFSGLSTYISEPLAFRFSDSLVFRFRLNYTTGFPGSLAHRWHRIFWPPKSQEPISIINILTHMCIYISPMCVCIYTYISYILCIYPICVCVYICVHIYI